MLLQLSSSVVLGSLGAVLGSHGLLTPAQQARAAGTPQELSGAVKTAVDKALDQYVTKAKVPAYALHVCAGVRGAEGGATCKASACEAGCG